MRNCARIDLTIRGIRSKARLVQRAFRLLQNLDYLLSQFHLLCEVGFLCFGDNHRKPPLEFVIGNELFVGRDQRYFIRQAGPEELDHLREQKRSPLTRLRSLGPFQHCLADDHRRIEELTLIDSDRRKAVSLDVPFHHFVGHAQEHGAFPLRQESLFGEVAGKGEVSLVDDGPQPKLLPIFRRGIEVTGLWCALLAHHGEASLSYQLADGGGR